MKLHKSIICSCLLIASFSVEAKSKVYLNKIYGQIHQNASKYSRVLTTFECGQPFKVLGDEQLGFLKVQYASYSGYVALDNLSKQRPKDCWQDKYPKFFDTLDLGVSQMHFWGRLQDLLIKGRAMP